MTVERLSSLGSIHLHPDRAKKIKVQEVYDIYYSFEGRRKISTRFEPYVSHKVDEEGEGRMVTFQYQFLNTFLNF